MTLPQSVWRILRRLFPALVTVVSVSAVAALLFLPASRWVQTGQDASAALLYVENLHLANQGMEYEAIGRGYQSLPAHLVDVGADADLRRLADRHRPAGGAVP